mmetsp:Transcript_18241/g.45607  ORF Transcript_18241/g.45607 Transcript_18241/m.45607 type:complete len:410 (-) Transcript_18241:382-1611(-)|eukprot:CAMPEP_0179005532 /NCGR_PEP_ID=MMETSP0795-20121207/13998_1 /TAXON_ID=88552 /ORGANISM="Amoebophrya sp., Strain Ameob2" /LENGTH=409 /DNA_ID=CAMNT_0020700087 /DNA_START=232 /DNA_END=1461 /DNA_ORIENTATION=-
MAPQQHESGQSPDASPQGTQPAKAARAASAQSRITSPSTSLKSHVPTLSELKMIALCGLYLSLNFVPLAFPFLIYGALFVESRLCQFVWVLVLLDYAVPLRMPGAWIDWCRVLDDTVGKKKYFDVEIIDEFSNCDRPNLKEDIQSAAGSNFFVIYHPHALFGVGHSLFARHLHDLYGVYPLFTGADIVAKIPLLRRFLVWMGYTPVSAAALRKNLQRPYPENFLTLLPGGIAEMFYGSSGDYAGSAATDGHPFEQLVLRKRTGFCKIALETGAHLVPVYCMGANQIYSRKFGRSSVFAKLSSKLQTSLVFWTDRLGLPFGFLPLKQKMVLCLGKPIWIDEKIENPTKEQIEALHARYVAALKDLFDRHKHLKAADGWGENTKLLLEDEERPVGIAGGAASKDGAAKKQQ